MTFEDDLAAETAAEIRFRDVDFALNGKPYTARFLQIDGVKWASEADKHPPRPGVLMDSRYGYNIRTLGVAVAKLSGRIVQADGTLKVIKAEQWDKIFKLAGSTQFFEAIWGLNEIDPEQAVQKAKKDAAAASVLPSD